MATPVGQFVLVPRVTMLPSGRQASLVQPVHASRCVMKQIVALGCCVPQGYPLEGVVQHVVRKGHLVHWKIALEHASVGPELLDGVIDKGGDGLR